MCDLVLAGLTERSANCSVIERYNSGLTNSARGFIFLLLPCNDSELICSACAIRDYFQGIAEYFDKIDLRLRY